MSIGFTRIPDFGVSEFHLHGTPERVESVRESDRIQAKYHDGKAGDRWHQDHCGVHS